MECKKTSVFICLVPSLHWGVSLSHPRYFQWSYQSQCTLYSGRVGMWLKAGQTGYVIFSHSAWSKGRTYNSRPEFLHKKVYKWRGLLLSLDCYLWEWYEPGAAGNHLYMVRTFLKKEDITDEREAQKASSLHHLSCYNQLCLKPETTPRNFHMWVNKLFVLFS